MEIERKFLPGGIEIPLEAYEFADIEQAYISVDPVIRVRKWRLGEKSEYILSCKGAGRMVREEWELGISASQYENLLRKAETGILRKRRCFIPLNNRDGSVAELDIYESPDRLAGLITIEVEFGSLSEAEQFVPPKWFGHEVTENPAFSNSSLIINGIPESTSF